MIPKNGSDVALDVVR